MHGLREHGVSHAGLIVLSTLGRGPTSQRDLADDQHVTEQTIGRTIAHLESTGHVIRRSDPTDRRRRVVELTDAGSTLLAEMFDTGERLTDDILTSAGADVGEFRSTLKTLITAMDPAGLRTGGAITLATEDAGQGRSARWLRRREPVTAVPPSWPARLPPGGC